MNLQRLAMQNFRGLSASQIDLSAGINVFYGDNGAGKSSVIEAIHFLSCCKSFRTRVLDNLIAYDNDWLSINAIASKVESGLYHSISVRRILKKNTVLIDDTPLYRASQLSQMLPALLVCSERQRLFIAPPQERRNFLDWGLFHVKPDSINLFSKYERSLRQRNASIKNKSNADLVKSWDQELIECGQQIIGLRAWFIDKLSEILNRDYASFYGDFSFAFQYEDGCGRFHDMAQALNDGFDQDCRYGYTRFGPHRSEFEVLYSGRNIKDNFSHGQTKLLIYFLALSQAQFIYEAKGVKPWLLLDDFASDFSEDTLSKAFSVVADSGCQVFITSAIDLSKYQQKYPGIYLFHVEHGNVKKMI